MINSSELFMRWVSSKPINLLTFRNMPSHIPHRWHPMSTRITTRRKRSYWACWALWRRSFGLHKVSSDSTRRHDWSRNYGQGELETGNKFFTIVLGRRICWIHLRWSSQCLTQACRARSLKGSLLWQTGQIREWAHCCWGTCSSCQTRSLEGLDSPSWRGRSRFV